MDPRMNTPLAPRTTAKRLKLSASVDQFYVTQPVAAAMGNIMGAAGPSGANEAVAQAPSVGKKNKNKGKGGAAKNPDQGPQMAAAAAAAIVEPPQQAPTAAGPAPNNGGAGGEGKKKKKKKNKNKNKNKWGQETQLPAGDNTGTMDHDHEAQSSSEEEDPEDAAETKPTDGAAAAAEEEMDTEETPCYHPMNPTTYTSDLYFIDSKTGKLIPEKITKMGYHDRRRIYADFLLRRVMMIHPALYDDIMNQIYQMPDEKIVDMIYCEVLLREFSLNCITDLHKSNYNLRKRRN